MPLFFFTVEQQERAIVERFGKFVRVAGPGLHRKSPFVEKVAGRMSLQVEQLNADIETKTKDNVFVVVKLAIQYMVGAEEEKVKDAFYKLDDPEVQMKSYAFDVVRSHIPTMDLDEAYADADTIAKHIQDTLQTTDGRLRLQDHQGADHEYRARPAGQGRDEQHQRGAA